MGCLWRPSALSSPPSRARAAPAAESQRAGGQAGKVRGRAHKGVCARDGCAERIAARGASICFLAHSAQKDTRIARIMPVGVIPDAADIHSYFIYSVILRG